MPPTSDGEDVRTVGCALEKLVKDPSHLQKIRQAVASGLWWLLHQRPTRPRLAVAASDLVRLGERKKKRWEERSGGCGVAHNETACFL